MKHLSKIFFLITVAILFLWKVPEMYNFATMKQSKLDFSIYSCVAQDFLTLSKNDSLGFHAVDRKGNIFNEDAVDLALPFFYIKQLIVDNKVPDSVCGVKVDAQTIRNTNFSFRSAARDINVPKVNLYFLLESRPKRGELYMPDDAFCFTDDGIEFLDMANNEVLTEKSAMFTKVMKQKGFVFPATDLSGITSVRKEYDEGFLVLDSNNKVYHLKQVVGRPYCAAIEFNEGIEIDKLVITEFHDRRILGFATDTDKKMHVILRNGYQVVESGLPYCDLRNSDVSIFGNMLSWTVRVISDNEYGVYALDALDFSLIDSNVEPIEKKGIWGLTFTSSKDKYVFPRL